MDIDKNAPLTWHSRVELVRRVLEEGQGAQRAGIDQAFTGITVDEAVTNENIGRLEAGMAAGLLRHGHERVVSDKHVPCGLQITVGRVSAYYAKPFGVHRRDPRKSIL